MSKACQIGLIQGGQMMDMTQNYSLWLHKGNFPGKTKNNRSIWICLKYCLSTSLLSTLMTYLKNILSGPDPGGQMMDMTQNCSLLRHKGNFAGILKNNKTTRICLKYGLRCAGASILEKCLKNNRLSPKTMVQKNLSLKIWVWRHTSDWNSQPQDYKPSALAIELYSSKASAGKELSRPLPSNSFWAV